jgi:hypothetical protein
MTIGRNGSTIADLSWMLGIPVDTLYGWRHRGLGPRGYRVARHVRYRRRLLRRGCHSRPTAVKTPHSSWPTSRSESVHDATSQGASAPLPDTEFGIESHRADCGSRPSSRQWMRNVAELTWKVHCQGRCGGIRVVAKSSSANG